MSKYNGASFVMIFDKFVTLIDCVYLGMSSCWSGRACFVQAAGEPAIRGGLPTDVLSSCLTMRRRRWRQAERYAAC